MSGRKGEGDLSRMPAWPRFLGRETAAAYLGVSVDVFDDEVREGIWPPARPRGARGGRLTWDRVLLDAAADRASGLTLPQAGGPHAESAKEDLSALWRARLDGKTSRQRPERHLGKTS